MFKVYTSIVFLILILTGCGSTSKQNPYCKKLIEIANKPNVSEQLVLWFDDNFKNKLISSKTDYRFGGLYVPGMYTYKKSFDWDLIDFKDRMPLIKLINIKEVNNNSEVFAEVNSISLAERSRASILVQSDGINDYGLGENSQSIIKITNRVAVYCMAEY